MNPAEFQASTPYGQFGSLAIDAPVDARRTFIRKTYTHLMMAVYVFVALEWLFFSIGLHEPLMQMLAGHPMYWLIVMGAFILVNFVADKWARSATSIGMQYAGLFLGVVAWSVLFIPLLAIAKLLTLNVEGLGQIGVIPAAGVTTLVMFGGLTAVAFVTKKDFSFLRSLLGISIFAAMALIVVSLLFGFHLGIWFSAAMVIVACGYILYDTSNIIHHYRTDQYVAAALALFASVALLFWYVVRMFIALSNRD
ncbi:MAG: Bax inhibitor-1 family protein [Pirellulales bacterium]